MDSTAVFPVLHHLLEFAQIQVHWVNDANQPSRPVFSLSSSYIWNSFPLISVGDWSQESW